MLRAFLRAYVRGVRRARADREASVEMLGAWAKYSRADAERAYAETLPTFDERGIPSPRAMAVFWRVMAAIGEASEPWPDARFLDRRFIDSFDDWAPPR